MFSSLTLLFIFVAASMGIAAGYLIYTDLFRPEASRTKQRMDEEFRGGSTRPGASSLLFKAGTQSELGALSPRNSTAGLRDGAEDNTWRGRLRTVLVRSGLNLTPRQLATVSTLAATVLAITGMLAGGWLMGLTGLVIGGLAPLAYVLRRARARATQFLTQLPAAFELMARVLRAGHSVPQAFQAVGDTFDGPIATEFGACQEQQNLGLLPEVTYRDLARRTGALEMRIFVMAMLVQCQTGGNLSEVLERLATLIRDRLAMRNKVRSLTAEGRLQALVLLVLPVLMFFVMRAVNRRYADVLLEHTGLLVTAGAGMLLGSLWIRRIVNFEI